MASTDEVVLTTAPDKVTMMAPDDGFDMPAAVNDEAATPTMPDIDEDHKSLDDETQSLIPPLSQNQVDGNADKKIIRYVAEPKDVPFAKIQGLAKLKEVLNDPDGEIADVIKKTTGFPDIIANNEKCKKVRDYLTGKSQTTKQTVPLVLATWCMLGGFIPSLWDARSEGKRTGSKKSHTDWGKEMRNELAYLGNGDGFNFKLCKGYATNNVARQSFNMPEFEEIVNQWDEDAKKAKKPKASATPASLGKHGASSPPQSLASKRPKTVATETPQQSEASYAGDDDIEDREGRAEVDNDMMDGGSEQGVPALKAPSTKLDFNRGGSRRPDVPGNGFRDQEDALLPVQKTWPPGPSAHRNQGPEEGLRNDGVSRAYGPGLITSNMPSNKKFMGQMSQGRNEVYSFGRPTASDSTADVSSSPFPSFAASSGQLRVEMLPALHQGSIASSVLTPLEMSASVNQGPAVSHGQSHSAFEHASGSGDANMVKGGGRGDTLLFPSSRQDPMPGRRQNFPRIASPVLRGSDGRGGKLGSENECLSSLSGSVTADREDPARLDEAVKSKAFVPGAQVGDVGQESQDTMIQPSRSFPLIEEIEKLKESAQKDLMHRDVQNDWFKSRISRLEKELQVKKAKIVDLEKEANILRAAGAKGRISELEGNLKESRQKEAQLKDLLNRTSLTTILEKAGTIGKPFASLAELIDENDGDDSMGASGHKDSEDHHGQSN